jgi:uncharacterized membrane protein
MDHTKAENNRDAADRRSITVIYILYFVGFATGLSAAAGVVFAHAKSGEVNDIWQSHITYQLRTFWYGLLMLFAGTLLTLVLVGFALLFWWVLWTVVRTVKGIMAANEGQPIDHPDTWLW